MKREQAAVALLLLLLAIALWNVRRADFLTGQLEENLLRSERALSRGDREMAFTALEMPFLILSIRQLLRLQLSSIILMKCLRMAVNIQLWKLLLMDFLQNSTAAVTFFLTAAYL